MELKLINHWKKYLSAFPIGSTPKSWDACKIILFQLTTWELDLVIFDIGFSIRWRKER